MKNANRPGAPAPGLGFQHRRQNNGTRSVQINFTPVRVVCSNTLHYALNDVQRSATKELRPEYPPSPCNSEAVEGFETVVPFKNGATLKFMSGAEETRAGRTSPLGCWSSPRPTAWTPQAQAAARRTKRNPWDKETLEPPAPAGRGSHDLSGSMDRERRRIPHIPGHPPSPRWGETALS